MVVGPALFTMFMLLNESCFCKVGVVSRPLLLPFSLKFRLPSLLPPLNECPWPPNFNNVDDDVVVPAPLTPLPPFDEALDEIADGELEILPFSDVVESGSSLFLN